MHKNFPQSKKVKAPTSLKKLNCAENALLLPFHTGNKFSNLFSLFLSFIYLRYDTIMKKIILTRQTQDTQRLLHCVFFSS